MSFHEHDLLHELVTLVEKPEMRFVVSAERKMKRKKETNREGGRGLMSVLMAGDGLTNAEVAERLDIKPSSVTAMTKEMTAKDLIHTQADELDKRQVRIYLTEKGRLHFENLANFQKDYLDLLFNGMSESERKQLESLLQRVNQGPSQAEYDALFARYQDKVLGLDKFRKDFEKAKKGCNI